MFLNVHDLALGEVGLEATAIGCANPDCRALTLTLRLQEFHRYPSGSGAKTDSGEVYHKWSLLPTSAGKPQPEYIPQQIRDDYLEACSIVSLSPKASATLARRCLQGMIRDFGGVKPSTLYKEIDALSAAVMEGTGPRDVSIDSIAALNSLRKIGNIGAHMEGDVDIIIPVDEGEANALIGLIELLLDEWYVERHKRTARFAEIAQIEREKADLLMKAKQKALPPPSDD